MVIMTVNFGVSHQSSVFFSALLLEFLRRRRPAGKSCWPQLFGCGQAIRLGFVCMCVFLKSKVEAVLERCGCHLAMPRLLHAAMAEILSHIPTRT